jgi:hypothetical protein
MKCEIGFGWKKKVCRSKYDTQKQKWTNRVKRQQLIKICGLSPGSRTVREMRRNTTNKTNVFEIECCGSFGRLPTERMKRKFFLWFLSEIGSYKSLRSCCQCSAHCKNWNEISLTRAWERATGACRCRRVSVGVQRYSVQRRGYNLIGVTTVEGDTARCMTTLVYLQLHISLYTGTVHVLSGVAGVHPTSLTVD